MPDLITAPPPSLGLMLWRLATGRPAAGKRGFVQAGNARIQAKAGQLEVAEERLETRISKFTRPVRPPRGNPQIGACLSVMFAAVGFDRDPHLREMAGELEELGGKVYAVAENTYLAGYVAMDLYDEEADDMDDDADACEAAAHWTDSDGVEHVDQAMMAHAAGLRMDAIEVRELTKMVRARLADHQGGSEYHSGEDAHETAYR